MEQTIMASHTVKPSSPTPLASKTHKLSFLDQMAPSLHILLIFLYERDQSKQQEEISERLKQSLSEILTIFYPLAGAIRQNSYVDCNDSGAEFVEARVHGRLAEFLQNPKFEDALKKLVVMVENDGDDDLILSVKTSFFDCGGIAVGVRLSHKLADGWSALAFVDAWAARCRGEGSRIIHPSFDVALRFPPMNSSWRSPMSLAVTNERFVTRRLVFEKEKVAKVRGLEASRSEVKDPSRVEAVSAFLWRSFIGAHRRAGVETASFLTTHVVNLRPRAAPPLPDHAFGNCITTAAAAVSGDGDGDLVSRLRAAIRGVDEDYIDRVVENVRSVDEGDNSSLVKPGHCGFTSWLRFPVYEVDFGWGKPARVCTVGMPFMNLVFLMDTPSGDGIEAWINVPDDHFFRFIQSDYDELLA
ncbi:stemmadenine O-acetyltransferase-like [Salvia miltiorrhiza]|uniref:stemmadenine O-acetyltransferase-like n=1 Tax=Salvia miltiorrhiza TaxID=226208 RepID=UPI0025ACDFA9|nr:stemmadenine O-acetyltransferase-like [Salvia miltiorrhiza]